MLRKLAGLMAMVMLLCAAVPALAAPGDANLFESNPDGSTDMYVEQVTVVGDTVYILGNGVYEWKVGDEQPVLLDMELEPGNNYALVGGGDMLTFVNSREGTLGVWDGKSIVWDGQLDWENMVTKEGDYDQVREFLNATLIDGALYALRGKDGQLWGEYDLVRFDLATGKSEEMRTQNVQQFVRYRPGKLAALCRDPEQWRYSVVEIDLATGESKPIWQTEDYVDLGGLAYDAANDALVALSSGKIVRLQAEGFSDPVAYLPVSGGSNNGFCAVISSGHYVWQSWQGIFVRNLDPQYKPGTVLRIANGYMSDDIMAFCRKNPDIAVEMVSERYFDSRAISEAISARDAGIDLFMVSTMGGYQDLRDKGYLMDLADSKTLTDAVSAMYPQVQNQLLQDGKLFGYPSSISTAFWSVDDAALQRVGFDGMPVTIDAWLGMIERWEEEEMAEANPGYTLLNEWYNKEQVVFQVLSAYMYQYAQEGEELRFDRPELLAALERAQQLPDFGRDPEESSGGVIIMSSEDSVRVLIEEQPWNLLQLPWNASEEYRPRLMMPPTFAAEDEPVTHAQLDVYVVNPSTANRDAAIRLLEFLSEAGDLRTRYLLRPDLNEPVPNASMVKQKQELEVSIAEQTASLETAEEADKKAIQEMIDMNQQWLNEMETRGYYWEVHPDPLLRYRELAPTMKITSVPLWSAMQTEGMGKDVSTLIERFRNGEMKAQDFLRELDKKMRMFYMENQ